MVSESELIFNSILSCRDFSSDKIKSEISEGSKPSFEILILYSPNGRIGKEKKPSESVETVLSRVPSALRMVISTPGSSAPFWSTTTPLKYETYCAAAG